MPRATAAAAPPALPCLAAIAGLSFDGQGYVYANPLQIRDGHIHQGTSTTTSALSGSARPAAHPNVMRTLASLEHYALIADDGEARLHQYTTGTFTADTATGPLTLNVATEYPWTDESPSPRHPAPPSPSGCGSRTGADHHDTTVNGHRLDDKTGGGWQRITRS